MTVGLQLLLFKFQNFQISHTYLNFKFQISRLCYPRHSVTELYALLVVVPQLSTDVHVHYS